MTSTQRYLTGVALVAATLLISLAAIADRASRADEAAKSAAASSDAVEAIPESAATDAVSKPANRDAGLKLPEPEGGKRLSPEYDVWIDGKNKAVIVDGQISLREGMLEMFACTRNTKEHESIVSANTKAYLVHAGLLSLGAEPGKPVQFVPKYRPPSGTEIDITVEWLDPQGQRKHAKAQEWIKDIHTKKPMKHPFVFAGSSFWTDEQTKKKHYQAEGGDFICVSNFGTAMLDIPVQSSQANTELAFEAFTDRIPPLGAPVRMILKPKLDKKQETRASAPRQPAQRAEPQIEDATAEGEVKQ